jgi:aromatic-L-amino-acid decarboxylase
LQHENEKVTIDYRHWGTPLSRRFRSLKLWFTFRSYGISGLQAYIRNHCNLAKKFEAYVRNDSRFEVVNEVSRSLVCFRLRATDKINQALLSSINASEDLHMIPSIVKGKYIIRFCVVYQFATEADIDFAWDCITKHANKLLEEKQGSLRNEMKAPKLSRRHSFTRSVSVDEYQRRASRNSLRDMATPIVVPEDEDDLDTTLDDVFSKGLEKPNYTNSV